MLFKNLRATLRTSAENLQTMILANKIGGKRRCLRRLPGVGPGVEAPDQLVALVCARLDVERPTPMAWRPMMQRATISNFYDLWPRTSRKETGPTNKQVQVHLASKHRPLCTHVFLTFFCLIKIGLEQVAEVCLRGLLFKNLTFTEQNLYGN